MLLYICLIYEQSYQFELHCFPIQIGTIFQICIIIQKMERQNIPKYLKPNWFLAECHGKASKIGTKNQTYIGQMCSCCFQHINKDLIPLNQNTKQLEFLGFGFPLYFSFVRNCIMLLFITICSYNLVALHRAISNNYQFCIQPVLGAVSNPTEHANIQNYIKPEQSFGLRHFRQNLQNKMSYDSTLSFIAHESSQSGENNIKQCTSWMIYFSNIESEVSDAQQTIRYATFFIHAFLLVYIREKLVKMKQYFDQRTTSLSDFSVFIKNLQPKKGLKASIQKVLTQQYQIKEIAQILLVPQIEGYEKLKHQKEKVMEELKGKIKNKASSPQLKVLDKQIQKIDLEIREVITKAKLQYKNDLLLSERAIVILNTQESKDFFLHKFHQKPTSEPGWSRVKVVQAPEPKEIIWENAGLNSKKRNCLVFIGWTLSVLLLVFLTIAFVFLSQYKSGLVKQKLQIYKQKNSTTNQLFEAKILVYGMFFLVILLNKYVISQFYHKFTQIERHSSTYKFQFSFCLKYCLGLFFTTALMTLLVQGFLLKNYYSHDYGLIEEETIMFVFVAFCPSILWIINFPYYIKKIVRKYTFGQVGMTQQQANQLMEDPEYDVGKRYAQILKTMWISFLYLTLIPIGAPISCVGLGIYYWVDKYNLLRRSTMRSNVSGQLIYLTLKLLDVTLILRALGQFIFDFQIRSNVPRGTFIMLLLSIIFQFIPFSKFLQFINSEKFLLEKKTYMEARHEFIETYYNKHILYSELEEDRKHFTNYLLNNLAGRKTMKDHIDH